MKAVLARADKINPKLNALTRIDAAESIAAARASERRWKKGKPLSPLDGVPVSIKELVRVKGWAHTFGSKLTDKTPQAEDSPAVARLREAGAIVYAQNTSSEFGHKGVTDSPLNGITRNPWNLGAYAGWLVRRVGRRGGGRPRAPRHRHRRRRLGAHPLLLLRTGRHQGDVRARGGLAALDDRRPRQHRADGTDRARLRVDDERHRPARPQGRLLAAGRRRRLCQGAGRQAEGAQGRFHAAHGRPSDRYRGGGRRSPRPPRRSPSSAPRSRRSSRRSPTPTPAALSWCTGSARCSACCSSIPKRGTASSMPRCSRAPSSG